MEYTIIRYAKAIYSTKLLFNTIKNIDDVLDGIKKMDKLEPNFPILQGKLFVGNYLKEN